MLSDRQEIHELIENWVIWRDTAEWERFATLWAPEGRMIATWFQANASEFIARSKRAWEDGVKVIHSLGGTSIDVNGTRAVAQTKMQLIQRAAVHGVLVDVTCNGRFIDALEKRDGRWVLRLRQPAYDMDRMVTVDPAASLTLDQGVLTSFPEGYRHLGYLQSSIGFTVAKNLPGSRGPEIDAVYRRCKRWLSGDDPSCLESSPEQL